MADLVSRFLNLAVPNQYLEQGSVDMLRKEAGLDPFSIADRVESRYKDIK